MHDIEFKGAPEWFADAVKTLGDSVENARAAPGMREELATALGHLALTMTYYTRFDEAWRAAQDRRTDEDTVWEEDLPLPSLSLMLGSIYALVVHAFGLLFVLLGVAIPALGGT